MLHPNSDAEFSRRIFILTITSFSVQGLYSALSYACEEGHAEIATLLLQHGAFSNKRTAVRFAILLY